MDPPIRLLLFGDTHLGLDDPERPRVSRRRRGPDFFANFVRALEPARRGAVDLVVHGGDLFHTPRVPRRIVHRALAELLRAAEVVPVVVLPGNHERSRFEFGLLGCHPRLHVLDRPRTVVVDVRGARVALSGFPFARRVGEVFAERVEATGWRSVDADVRVLCVHQSVEGATVGAHDFTFRPGRDVITGASLPWGFAAVLSGHIHRSQILRRDLRGRALPCPVIYAGSTERTSVQELMDPKGYRLVDLAPGPAGGHLLDTQVVPLPARPMFDLRVPAAGRSAAAIRADVGSRLATLPADAVVLVRPLHPCPEAEVALSAPALRALAPATMNVRGTVGRQRSWRSA